MLIDPELQIFAIKLTKKILPEVEGIVETYIGDPEAGFSAYLDFVKKSKPSLKKIILEGLRDPLEVGLISPRLLRDPLDTALVIRERSAEEKEAHVVGYLKAILELVYCSAKGLEGWQFSNTILYEESQKLRNIGEINMISSLAQIVKQEINDVDSLEQFESIMQENESTRENLGDIQKAQTWLRMEQVSSNLHRPTDDESTALPFTARLMAYYRSQEYKKDSPLIIDPFAERLAGDMIAYANKHKFVAQRGDYSLVRSYFIENNLLIPWCSRNKESQIVLLGAGLDTRAYRLDVLQMNKHTFFELDFSTVTKYKETIMKNEKSLCDLVCISVDLSKANWASLLIERGFSTDTPTFWVLEGLAYYMEQKLIASLLKKTAEISSENSQIFVDICVPALADLVFGPFTRYFKWGLDKKAIPSFFASVGWNVSCSFADDHDQGRDVGQRGLIFVEGARTINV